MAEKKKLTVAEILALARKDSGGGGEAAAKKKEEAAPSEPATSEAAASTSGGEESAKPAPAKAAPAKPTLKPGEKPSVKDILAMARAGQGASTPAAPAEKKPAVEKAAEKKAPVEKKPAKAEAAEAGPISGAEKDTASILAAARKGSKLGPMSKAEAEAKGKESPAPVSEKKGKIAVPPMPPKPSYAKGKTATGKEAPRRIFILSALAIGFIALGATLGMWTLGMARFMFPNILAEPPSKFKVGFPSDYAPGYVENKYKAQFGVWVVNAEYQGRRQIFALSTVCTHLGCTPNWLEAEQKYKCPCHGSGFYKEGINFEGPAPRPLERYAIRLADDGQLEVDKSRKFQEELGQWNDADCFINI